MSWSNDTRSVSYRDHPASFRSQVAASNRPICGATARPTSPDSVATALHQRESSFAFLMSPITDTVVDPGEGSPWPVASITSMPKTEASSHRPVYREPSESEKENNPSTSSRPPAYVSAPSPAWLVDMSKTIVSTSPSLKTASPLSGSARVARTIDGAVTPASPLISSSAVASAGGDEPSTFLMLPLMRSRDAKSPPHRQRAAERLSAFVSGSHAGLNRVKPPPVSVTAVPPRLGPPSGTTCEKAVGWS